MINKKIGILGGGQLGKMLCLAAGNWHLDMYCLDKSKDFPAGGYCTDLVEGDFNNYEDVLRFGREMDIITIEIEHVNTDALKQLEKEGKTVYPSAAALETIKDKGLQKLFYQKNNIPTAPFQLFENKETILSAIEKGDLKLPFVQKSRAAGYDGKGVAVIQNEADLETKLMDCPSMIEDKVELEKELSVIVARNDDGQTQCFPLVDMEFNPIANLVEFLVCPAEVSNEIAQESYDLAKKVADAFDTSGLLAVELFLDKAGNIMVNEVAPRTHNSGHHTIDSCYTSQFEQQLRAITNMPLGSTAIKSPAVMVNILGAAEHTGKVVYKNIEKCMAMPGVNFHIYGKAMTKPFRKMGHATVLAADIETAKTIGRAFLDTFRVESES